MTLTDIEFSKPNPHEALPARVPTFEEALPVYGAKVLNRLENSRDEHAKSLAAYPYIEELLCDPANFVAKRLAFKGTETAMRDLLRDMFMTVAEGIDHNADLTPIQKYSALANMAIIVARNRTFYKPYTWDRADVSPPIAKSITADGMDGTRNGVHDREAELLKSTVALVESKDSLILDDPAVSMTETVAGRIAYYEEIAAAESLGVHDELATRLGVAVVEAAQQ